MSYIGKGSTANAISIWDGTKWVEGSISDAGGLPSGIESVSSSSNVTSIDASTVKRFKLNDLAEDTEIQIPTGGVDGDHLVLTIEQNGTGGNIVTWASGYQNDGQLIEVSTEADRVSVIDLYARDYGSGVVWSYIISNAETIVGLTDIDAFIQTTDTTVTTIATFATSTDNAVYLIDASYVGIDKTAGHVYQLGLRSLIYRNGSSTLSIANTDPYSEYNGDDATWAATVDVDGTDILLRVQGDATNAVEWHVKGIAKEHF